MSKVDVDGVVTRLQEIKTQIEALTDEKQGLTSLLVSTLGADTKIGAAGYKVTVSKPTERLNTKRLTSVFPFEENPTLYKPVIDTQKVREQTSPAMLATLGVYDVGAPTVTIR